MEYVRGEAHTNGLENFWSLLKRSIHGTYVSVEPFHLFRYLDEQAYRFNNRRLTDSERMDIAVRHIVGNRITYDQFTGKEPEMRAAFSRIAKNPAKSAANIQNKSNYHCFETMAVGIVS